MKFNKKLVILYISTLVAIFFLLLKFNVILCDPKSPCPVPNDLINLTKSKLYNKDKIYTENVDNLFRIYGGEPPPKPSFWQRNKYDIVMGIVFTVCVVVLYIVQPPIDMGAIDSSSNSASSPDISISVSDTSSTTSDTSSTTSDYDYLQHFPT